MLSPHTSNLKFVPLPLRDTHSVLTCSSPHPSLKCSCWLLFKPFRCFQVVVFLKFYWVSHFQGHICPRRAGLGHILDSAFDFFSKETQRSRIVVGRGSIPGPESGLLSNTWKWIIWKYTSTDKNKRLYSESPIYELSSCKLSKMKRCVACPVTKFVHLSSMHCHMRASSISGCGVVYFTVLYRVQWCSNLISSPGCPEASIKAAAV